MRPLTASDTAVRNLDLAGRTVLVATDGSPQARSAAQFAALLEQHRHATVHAISVVDTSTVPIPIPLGTAIGLADAAIGEGVHARQREDVQQAIAETIRRACTWPVDIAMGTPAHAIVRHAREIGASLVVLGLRRHGPLDRAIHDETVIKVMASAPCPVLGVALGTVELPRRIVAAVDFGLASLEAASAACRIAGDASTLVLTYVSPALGFPPADGEGVIHRFGLQAAFERATERFTRPEVHVAHIELPHELSHSVANLLLEYASDTNASLIAAGSRRHSRGELWKIGSVSRDLVRDGRHSVLVVPPPTD